MYNGVHNINERLLMSPEEKFIENFKKNRNSFLPEYIELVNRHFPTEEEKFLFEWGAPAHRAHKNNWGEPTNQNRGGEIVMAILLGDTISPTRSGADAYDSKGRGLEYKSTTGEKLQGTYNGISNKDSWAEQEKYLREEKIGKYHKHKFSLMRRGFPEEVWELSGKKVLDILIPKVKRQFYALQEKLEKGNIPADPRFGVTLTEEEIKKNGVKII